MRRMSCRMLYALLVLQAPLIAWAEDVTVTTYYPSPRGVYDELRTAGDVVIGDVATPAVARLQVEGGGILARGSVGNTPVAGDGTRLMWIPAKAAFRAGLTAGVRAADWDDVNIGVNSVGLGANTKASGWASQALGYDVTASGVNAIAIGIAANATGLASITIGQGVSLADPLLNAQASSLAVGFISDLPTLFVGPSSGVGTTGNVGIGTSSPAAKLDIVQESGFEALRVQDQAADPTPFVIDADGDVGIGTVPASSKLDIVQTGGANALLVQDQAADPTPFRVDSAGNVFVGGQFHLEDVAGVAGGDMYVSGGSDGIFYILNTNTNPVDFPNVQRIVLIFQDAAGGAHDLATFHFDRNPSLEAYTRLKGDFRIENFDGTLRLLDYDIMSGPVPLLTVTGEATFGGVANDGTGKVVCIKADKTFGTCDNAPDAMGQCFCQ